MTTEQKLDHELDIIEDTLAAIKKMLEWPEPAHSPRDDHSPIDAATIEAVPGCCAPEVATTASHHLRA